MRLSYLLPETVARQNGAGAEVELDHESGKRLMLTLGITRTIEQESLDVEIWGSSDKSSWGEKPLLKFPQKFYCGNYSMLLNLEQRSDVKFLRVKYKLSRWGRGDANPLFGFYVFSQEAAHATTIQTAVA